MRHGAGIIGGGLLLGALLCGHGARAEPAPEGGTPTPEALEAALAPLVAARDADALSRARAVSRCPRGAVLAALAGPELPVALRLAAIRGAAWMPAPEAALAPLVDLMGSRDGVLAAAAANAVMAISGRLDASALAAREVGIGALSSLRPPLRLLAGADHLRPDVRARAVEALAWLDGLTPVPPEEPEARP